MKTAFKKQIENLMPHYASKKVFVAVSGGIDSMALLALCQKLDLKPTALHCNFKLRGEASDLDEALVKSFCATNQLPVKTITFDTKTIAAEKQENIQLCARNLRYNWFNKYLKDDSDAVLLTAHHADDAIETFFINVLRGTGLKGLTGIPAKRQAIYRPLLHFNKADIIEFVTLHAIPYRHDESNNDTQYTRNKIRQQVIPGLKKLAPQLEQKMSTLLYDLQKTDEFLEAFAHTTFEKIVTKQGESHQFLVTDLLDLPYPILLKIIAKYDVQRHQISEITKLCEATTGALFSNQKYDFLKNRTQIIIQPKRVNELIHKDIQNIPTKIKIGEQLFQFSFVQEKDVKFSSHTAYLNYSQFKSALIVSNQIKGEKIQPLGMTGSKLISDLLTDAKINRFDKEKQLIIKHEKDVVWVVGKTIHAKYAINPETKKILKIEILE